ncbi:MAG: DUF1501 domain-containing protein [Planctomycetes bacterium]|nr:DUF1501 domain-containing protein [Planctomycetota bacterium]
MIGTRSPSLARELALAGGWCVAAAMAWGLVEATWRVARGEVPIGGARLLPAAALLYGVLGAGLALGQVVLRRALGWPRRQTAPAALPEVSVLGWHFSVAAAIALVALVAYPLNRWCLADALGGASLALNGTLLAIGAPLLAWALRRVSAAAAAWVARTRWLRARVALLLLLVTVAGAAWRLASTWSAAGPSSGGSARLGRTTSDSAAHGSAARFNVLLIVLDTLRADRLGCYGHSRSTSPNIDAIAARGVLFEECLAQAPHTKPSTASLLTGRLPPRLGVEPFGAALPDDEWPLAELLHAAGWRTGLFSANAFVAPTFGFGQGVERYVGPMVSPAAPLAAFHVLARLRDVWVEALQLPEAPWRWYEALVSLPFDMSGARNDPRAAELTQELLRFVDAGAGSGSSGGGGAPWFAHVQWMETHAPYRPRAEHRVFEGAREQADVPASARHLFLPFTRAQPLPPAELDALNATYDACIHEVDAEVGALLKSLETRDLLDSTLVIVTADHGEEFYDHGGFGHGHSLHRELLHVPMILRAPELLPAGRRVASQVRSLDLLPTLLELLAVELPAGAPPLDGESLLSLLRRAPSEASGASAESAPRPAFASVEWGGSHAFATRDGTRTVIVARDGSDERILAFDPTADPREQHDLAAADPREAEAATATARTLEAFARAAAAGHAAGREAALDPAMKSLLQRLGYAAE